MSIALLKTLRFGRDFSLKSLAVCAYAFDRWKDGIDPAAYNPLVTVTGGLSILSIGPGDYSMDAVLIGNDWINRCHDVGADTKNAILSLAYNHDHHLGMVALALEMAGLAIKPNCPTSIRLTTEEYRAIIELLYMSNFGGIYTAMSERWRAVLKEEDHAPIVNGRAFWRSQLGYDVFIHPATLEPCRDSNSTPLEYLGLLEQGDDAFFRFRNRVGAEFKISDPPAIAA